MAISISLLEYLEWEGVDYELVHHAWIGGSMRTAEAAHIPGEKLAKCVVLEDETGYLMAVLPATHIVDIETLSEELGRDLQLASEIEIKDMFEDCATGAIPPTVKAFGYEAVETVIDDSLNKCDDIYFEAGNHTELVHLRGDDFANLMADSPHLRFSHHV